MKLASGMTGGAHNRIQGRFVETAKGEQVRAAAEKQGDLTATSSRATSTNVPLLASTLVGIHHSHLDIIARLDMLLELRSAPARAPYCTFVSTLACHDIQVVKPIPVTVEDSGHGVIATFVEAGIAAGGETLADAVESLQEMLAMSFDTLAPMADEDLGPRMRRTRDVLLEFLCHSTKTTLNVQPKS